MAMANLAGQTMVNGQTPINYYSNFVSTLGSTVAEVQTENTAQNASVTQLQTQNNALSSVNLNDEAAAMSNVGDELPGGLAGLHDAEHDHGFGTEPGQGDGGGVRAATSF